MRYLCETCGVEFIPTCHKTRQKYCSKECRNKKNNAKRYYGGEVEVCLECGVKLEQSGGKGRWKRYCSESCRKIYNRRCQKERRANAKKPIRMCPNCGKEFEPNQNGNVQRFCGDSCRIEWWREYHKVNREDVEKNKICVVVFFGHVAKRRCIRPWQEPQQAR